MYILSKIKCIKLRQNSSSSTAAATSPPSDLWSWAYIVICNLTILDEMETNLWVQVFLTECDTTRLGLSEVRLPFIIAVLPTLRISESFTKTKTLLFWKQNISCREIAKVGNTVTIGDVSASPWRTRTEERIGRVIILLLLQNLFASWNYSEQAMAPKSSNRTLSSIPLAHCGGGSRHFLLCPSTAFLLHVLSQNTIVPLDFWKCEKNFR